MNIEEAMNAFDEVKGSKYSPADRVAIRKVAEEHGLTEFELKTHYITDVGDLTHFHPTMIVSGKPYDGSYDRGPHPFPKYPHHMELTGWKEKSVGVHGEEVATVLCPTNFVKVPIGTECACGEIHFA